MGESHETGPAIKIIYAPSIAEQIRQNDRRPAGSSPSGADRV